jgi:hypothetical protein
MGAIIEWLVLIYYGKIDNEKAISYHHYAVAVEAETLFDAGRKAESELGKMLFPAYKLGYSEIKKIERIY